MNPAIGELTCPVCLAAGNGEQKATLHRESKGRAKAFYLRCDCCGTLQPRKIGGQENIKKMIKADVIRLYEPGSEQDQAAQVVAEAARVEAVGQIKKTVHENKTSQPEKPADQEKPKAEKKGLFGFLSEGAGDE